MVVACVHVGKGATAWKNLCLLRAPIQPPCSSCVAVHADGSETHRTNKESRRNTRTSETANTRVTAPCSEYLVLPARVQHIKLGQHPREGNQQLATSCARNRGLSVSCCRRRNWGAPSSRRR